MRGPLYEVRHSLAMDVVQEHDRWKRKQRAEHKCRKIFDLVCRSGGFRYADARDHVYAVLSLHDQKTQVIPNYSRTVLRLFRDMADILRDEYRSTWPCSGQPAVKEQIRAIPSILGLDKDDKVVFRILKRIFASKSPMAKATAAR